MIAAGTVAATASDLIAVPVHSADATVPVAGEGYDWNGFYAGVYGVTQTDSSGDVRLGAGVEAGVNAQLDFFLVGGQVALHGLTNDTIDTAYGEVTGRGGLLLTDDLLAYAAAGYGMELTQDGRSDVLAGGGLEYAVNNDLSINAEYMRGFSLEGDNPTDQFTLGARFHF
jgi:outer membrane immunogenic protein